MSQKIGVSLSIDVKSIDKSLLKAHTNGKTYLNMTVFIDPDNPGQYGDHGMITQELPKERRDGGEQGAILGNAKVFWRDGQQAAHQQGIANAQAVIAPADNFPDDDIPF